MAKKIAYGAGFWTAPRKLTGDRELRIYKKSPDGTFRCQSCNRPRGKPHKVKCQPASME